jgi:DNA polymerase-3 subunit epsilon
MSETPVQTTSEPHEVHPPNRLYLDTETTGLDPDRHEIIELAIVVEEVPEDPTAVGKITQKWCEKICPMHIRAAEPTALEVNGYTPFKWEGALPFAVFADEIAQLITSASCIVGHNPFFDVNFLKAAFRREGLEVRFPYHLIDTVTMGYVTWNWTGTGPGLKLDKLRAFTGIPTHDFHSALQDALDCRRVLYAARGTLTGIPYQVTD